jgi:lycopene cyclase domain-containing protein
MGDGWRHASYAAMLALVLVAVLPLHLYYRLDVLGQTARLLKTVLPVAGVFVTWDVAATAAGQWHFDPAQTFAGRLWGLPLEEYAFFLVIPFAAILTLEAVTAARARRHKS